MTLYDLQPNKKALVVSISGNRVLKRRLISIGILPGKQITVQRIAPLGDPRNYQIDDFSLSLRNQEAEQIIIEEITGKQ